VSAKGAAKPAASSISAVPSASKSSKSSGKIAPPPEPAEPKRPKADSPAPPPPLATSPRPAVAVPAAYTLEQLVARFGESSELEVFTLVAADRAELTAMGSEVGSGRIDADSARLYGQAGDFFAAASPVQKRALRGFTPNLLRIATWAARRSQTLWQQREHGLAEIQARKGQRVQDAEQARKRALAVRDQWRALLRALSGGDPRRDSDIERAYGRAKEASELSRSLSALASLGRSYLVDHVHAARARDSGLDTNFLAETERLAAAVPAQIATGVTAREDAAVTQAEVDLWDGVNLLLLGCILDLFEAAHVLDPSVPRLLPLALRRGSAQPAPASPADSKLKVPTLPPG